MLNYLFLTKNRIKSLKFLNNLNCKNLLILDISNSNIEILEKEIFRNLNYLENLIIKNLNIKRIEMNFEYKFNNLKF